MAFLIRIHEPLILRDPGVDRVGAAHPTWRPRLIILLDFLNLLVKFIFVLLEWFSESGWRLAKGRHHELAIFELADSSDSAFFEDGCLHVLNFIQVDRRHSRDRLHMAKLKAFRLGAQLGLVLRCHQQRRRPLLLQAIQALMWVLELLIESSVISRVECLVVALPRPYFQTSSYFLGRFRVCYFRWFVLS